MRQPAVLSFPSFPSDLGCLRKIHVCWQRVTQISVCTFCLSGSRYWEHHSVYVRRGSGSTPDRPHVVSFEWPPPPSSPVLFLAKVAWSVAKGDTVLPGLFTQYIVELDTFWNTSSISAKKNALPVKLKAENSDAFRDLFIPWLMVEQLLDGVLSRWLLQPACLCAAHSQEGWHNHDNGKDGAEGQGEGWSGGKGAEIPTDVLMCLRPPAFHPFPLFPPAFLFYRLLLLIVDMSNICLWVMQTLAKHKLLSCTSEWGLFFKERGVYGGRMRIPFVLWWHPFSW